MLYVLYIVISLYICIDFVEADEDNNMKNNIPKSIETTAIIVGIALIIGLLNVLFQFASKAHLRKLRLQTYNR